jgi:hypothetical protein
MFMSILIHEAAHSEVVWYGQGVCDSPELGGIKMEGGKYVEGQLWDGVSDAEFTNNFSSNVMILEHVGMRPFTLLVGPLDFKCLLSTDFGIVHNRCQNCTRYSYT